MAKIYLQREKMTRVRKLQGVNYIEHPRGDTYRLGWTNTRQSIIIQISREVYNTLRKIYD